MAKKPKPSSSLQGIEDLLQKADSLLKEKKKEKRTCKIEGCGKMVYLAGKCKEHYLDGRALREEKMRGKRWVSTNGYEYTYDDELKPKLYHRYLMEQKIGRPLLRKEKVAHRDGDRLNNTIENLVLVVGGVVVSEISCPNCNHSFIPISFDEGQPQQPSKLDNPLISDLSLDL